MADNLVDCAYCDALVNPKDVPTVDDDETWQRIASAHSVDCEWVLTRAHRVNLERVESDNYSIPEWRLLAMLALKPGLTR